MTYDYNYIIIDYIYALMNSRKNIEIIGICFTNYITV